MSMPRSRRIRKHLDLLLVLVAALGMAGLAQARQTDKNQPIHVGANSFAGSQDSGKITFTGNVKMDQGTFKADGVQAVGYTDPNDTSQWQRIVLTGTPAYFQQTQDNGTLVHGQAQTIDYKVSENTVILTGDAEVVQEGRGEFHGNQLTYNTDTGEIQGTPTAGGRVHITLQPKAKPAGARPAPTAKPPSSRRLRHRRHPHKTTQGSTPPAPPSTAPVPAVSTPAPAATAGTH